MTDEQITQAAFEYGKTPDIMSTTYLSRKKAFIDGAKYHRDHSESQPDYTKTDPAYTDLFELLYNEHGITALQNELQEIETVCNRKLVKQLNVLRDEYEAEVELIKTSGFGFLNRDILQSIIEKLNKIIES